MSFDGRVIEEPWTPYIPTWTGTGGNPTIANHSIFAGYTRIGNTLIGSIKIVFGSSGYGSGTWLFGLPIPAASGFNGSFMVTGMLYDNSAPARGQRGGYLFSNVEMALASEAGVVVGPTVPWTWAVNDVLVIGFVGQCAS